MKRSTFRCLEDSIASQSLAAWDRVGSLSALYRQTGTMEAPSRVGDSTH